MVRCIISDLFTSLVYGSFRGFLISCALDKETWLKWIISQPSSNWFFLHFLCHVYYIFIILYKYMHAYIYIYIYIIIIINSRRQSRVLQLSLSLSHHLSLLFITHCRSSRLHPESALSWNMSVFTDWLTLVCLCSGNHRRTSLVSLSSLIHKCLECFFPITWIVYIKGAKWTYICYFMLYCFPNLFKTVRSILV